MESHLESAIDNFYSALGSAALPGTGGPAKKERMVVKNYKRPSLRSVAKKAKQQAACPRCGELVPVEDLAEHMKIELLDPRYLIQRQQTQRRDNSIAYDGSDIEHNLSEFAARRTDLFGREDLELGIGEKAGEDKTMVKKILRERESSAWDGHAASTGTSATGSVGLEQTLASIAAKTGGAIPSLSAPPVPAPSPPAHLMTNSSQSSSNASLPPIPMPTSTTPAQPPPPSSFRRHVLPSASSLLPSINIALQAQRMPTGTAAAMSEYYQSQQPPAKKQKTEVTFLPEKDFLAMFSGEKRMVTFNVEVPIVLENKKYKLEGQSIPVRLSMEDQVLKLKEHLEKELGVPPKKQKLKPLVDGGYNLPVLKDTNTFASYNLAHNVTIQFTLQERGGKK